MAERASDRFSGNGSTRTLIRRERIARRVRELARQIARRYAGRELTIVAILAGSVVFLADLIRHMPVRMRLRLASVCSYPGRATRSRGPRFRLPVEGSFAGRDVLILDDILDTGRTLQAVANAVRARRPASLRTCVLLKKDRPDLPGRIEPDFWGFQVPAEFVVGYGLDHDNLYRNLPDVRVLGDVRRAGGRA